MTPKTITHKVFRAMHNFLCANAQEFVMTESGEINNPYVFFHHESAKKGKHVFFLV